MDRQAATWQGLQILASASETDCMGEGVSEERNQEPMAQKWDSPHIRAHTCVDVGAGSLLSCGNLQVSRVGGKCLYPPHWFYFKSTMTTQGIGCFLQTDSETLLLEDRQHWWTRRSQSGAYLELSPLVASVQALEDTQQATEGGR